jgi:hypothetical protein
MTMADRASRLAHIMDYQVKSWFGASAPSVVSHRAVQALLAKWAQIKAERDPVLADFWHEPDEALAENAILLLRSDPDYLYLHHGRALRERFGFSMQGLTLSDLRTRIRPHLLELFDRTAAEFTPAYFQSFDDLAEEVLLWGRLCLPLRLSTKDRRLALLLYCHPIADEAMILEALFERSRSSTLIATPIRDEHGRIVDAWIVAQNEEAAKITGIAEHATGNLLLRSTALFARDDLWTHLVGRLAAGSAAATITIPRQELTVAVELQLIGDYVVVRATPVAEPAQAFTLS